MQPVDFLFTYFALWSILCLSDKACNLLRLFPDCICSGSYFLGRGFLYLFFFSKVTPSIIYLSHSFEQNSKLFPFIPRCGLNLSILLLVCSITKMSAEPLSDIFIMKAVKCRQLCWWYEFLQFLLQIYTQKRLNTVIPNIHSCN